MRQTDCDVLIIGGGPVGLATALYAHGAGFSTLVLEPRRGVIDKACGEGLMPGAVQALQELGVDPQGQRLRGIRYVDRRRSAQADFRAGSGRGVRRTTLHAALRAGVQAAGVEVLPVAAGEVSSGIDVVTVGTQHRKLLSRYVIAADGLHSPTRRRLGLDAPSRAPKRWGQRRHYAVAPWTEHVEVHWSARAEAYVTPVDENIVGVAVLSGRRAPMQSHLGDFPELSERLDGADPVSTVRGSGPLRQRSAARVAGRVLLVGDASGYVDALTGEGISLGIAHGRAAVEAITAGRHTSYERAWRRETWRYAALTHALLLASRPTWARPAIVPLAATVPGLFSTAVVELGRTRSAPPRPARHLPAVMRSSVSGLPDP